MHGKGKHAKAADDAIVRRLLIILVCVLVVIQLLMLNQQVRKQLSIVDFLEGEPVEMEKK